MKRLAVSVEGQTELEFVTKVLRAHLQDAGWHLVKAVTMGGGLSMKRIKDEVRLLSGNFDAVTTLYDLYGFHGMDGKPADEVEAEMKTAVGAVPLFVPYIQQYEFEALLLSEPAAVAAVMGSAVGVNLHPLTGGLAPEQVNDGFDTCPSRRISTQFRAYDKALHGPVIAQRIGLIRMRAECPRFSAWVSRLENLAA